MRAFFTIPMAAGVLIVSGLPLLRAQVPIEVQKGLEMQVDGKVAAAVKELVTPEWVIKELFLTPPITEPSKSHDQLAVDIKAEVERRVAKRFPESLVDGYRKEAKNKYPPLEVGDWVVIQLKDGSNRKGMLRKNDGNGIQVNQQYYKNGELSDRTRLLLNHRKIRFVIADEVKEKQDQLRVWRNKHRRDIWTTVERELYINARYMMIEDLWISIDSYFKQVLKEKRKVLTAELRPKLQRKVYYAAGYVLFNEIWMTRKQAEDQKAQIDSSGSTGIDWEGGDETGAGEDVIPKDDTEEGSEIYEF